MKLTKWELTKGELKRWELTIWEDTNLSSALTLYSLGYFSWRAASSSSASCRVMGGLLGDVSLSSQLVERERERGGGWEGGLEE